MASPQQIKTTVTDLLKINHPIMLAGMNVAAGPKLAAAVTNAGGLGVIGGVSLHDYSACISRVLLLLAPATFLCLRGASSDLQSLGRIHS